MKVKILYVISSVLLLGFGVGYIANKYYEMNTEITELRNSNIYLQERNNEVNIKLSESMKKIPKVDSTTLFDLINNWRISNNYKEYKESYVLCGFAEKRAKEAEIDWSHNGFENLSKFDYLVYNHLGENLARNQNTPQETLNQWLNSPTHKDNLQADYTDSCIRCYKNICAQEFGSF